jgi:hypothetical protein
MTAFAQTDRQKATPCCHSRRLKAALDFTPKADIGLIGLTRPKAAIPCFRKQPLNCGR